MNQLSMLCTDLLGKINACRLSISVLLKSIKAIADRISRCPVDWVEKYDSPNPDTDINTGLYYFYVLLLLLLLCIIIVIYYYYNNYYYVLLLLLLLLCIIMYYYCYLLLLCIIIIVIYYYYIFFFPVFLCVYSCIN
jgi:hypothetical protein